MNTDKIKKIAKKLSYMGKNELSEQLLSAIEDDEESEDEQEEEDAGEESGEDSEDADDSEGEEQGLSERQRNLFIHKINLRRKERSSQDKDTELGDIED